MNTSPNTCEYCGVPCAESAAPASDSFDRDRAYRSAAHSTRCACASVSR